MNDILALAGQNRTFLLALAAGIVLILLVLLILRRRKRVDIPAPTSLFVPRAGFADSLKALFNSAEKDLMNLIPELEEILLAADVGVPATQNLIQNLASQKGVQGKNQAYAFLKNDIQKLLTPKSEFKIDTTKKPFVIYLVGVNGVGKTTTIGKLARQYKDQGLKVMLVAADTFRAAAVEQLRIWSERNEVDFVGGKHEADPSSVIVDGLRSAKSKDMDIVLVDTAGRLQTKQNLMNELQKMVRMAEKELGKKPEEIFLVVDAITGQNGFSQAQLFIEAVPLTGIVLTKYDATSKGGIIISIVQKTGLPIRYVGLGEKIDDLKAFDAEDFVNKIF